MGLPARAPLLKWVIVLAGGLLFTYPAIIFGATTGVQILALLIGFGLTTLYVVLVSDHAAMPEYRLDKETAGVGTVLGMSVAYGVVVFFWMLIVMALTSY